MKIFGKGIEIDNSEKYGLITWGDKGVRWGYIDIKNYLKNLSSESPISSGSDSEVKRDISMQHVGISAFFDEYKAKIGKEDPEMVKAIQRTLDILTPLTK
ncbi:MAG: hypothetical protein KAS32_03870 [Candidatus Peribacteraceae bacterium]|nr:hypothetical protein [Candidatus Peribacteraceae bacterium]